MVTNIQGSLVSWLQAAG